MSGNPQLTDDQLRALVRDAVARHLGQPVSASAAGSPHGDAFATGGHQSASPHASAFAAGARPTPPHASHARYALSSGGDGEGACLIEPNVRCNHCGYCQSHGH